MAKDLRIQISQVDYNIVDKGAGVALEINIIKSFEAIKLF